MNSNPDEFITTTEIAQLPPGGVSVATVSNWRRRYGEGLGDQAFPAKVETEGSKRPLFRRAEVLAWLRRNKSELGPFDGEPAPDPGLRQTIRQVEWLLSEGREEDEVSPLFLAQVIGDLVSRQIDDDLERKERRLPEEVVAELARLRSSYRPVQLDLDRVVSDFCDGSRKRGKDLFAAGLAWGRPGWASRSSTGSVAELVAALSESVLALASSATVLDPAVGEGAFFGAIAGLSSGQATATTRFLGVDIDVQPLILAWQRSIIDSFDAEFRLGDSLEVGTIKEALKFPLIVCNPVFDAGPAKKSGKRGPPRGTGRPGRELAWATVCQDHLDRDGRALLVVPRSALIGRGSAMTARRELLASGALEAVVGLPPGVLEQSRGPSAVLVITGADDLRPTRERVLFLDLQDLHAREFGAEHVELVSDVLDRWRSTGTLTKEGPFGERAHVVGLEEVIGSGRQASLSLLPGDWVPEVVDEGARIRMRQALEDGPRLLGEAADAAESAIGQIPGLAVQAHSPQEPEWHKLRELIDQGAVELLRAVPQSSLRSNPGISQADAAEGEIVQTPAWQVEPSSRRPVVTATEGIPHDPRLAVDSYLTRPGDVIVNPVAGAAFGGIKAEVDTEGGRLITHPLEGLRVGDNYQRTLPAVVLRAALEARRNQPQASENRAVGKPAPGRVRVQEFEVPVLQPREAQALEEALRKLDDVRTAGHHLADTASGMADGLLEFPPRRTRTDESRTAAASRR